MANSGARYMGIIFALFVAVAIVGWAENKAHREAPAESPAIEPAAADAPAKPKRDFSDLVQDAEYRKRNARGFRQLHKLFRDRGLTCPAITHMWDRGVSPFGLKVEVLCGPAGTDDAYPTLHYSVYPERGMVSICSPFGESLATCS